MSLIYDVYMSNKLNILCNAALQRGHFQSVGGILKALEVCPQEIKEMNWAALGEKWNGKLPLQSGEMKVG